MMQVEVGLATATTRSSPSAPTRPQECFDLMIKAFNLAETYRVPVFFMMDEVRRPHDRAGRHP
ncbi:MAG: hypothetical protein MZV49_06790, partial [Rhodopseudomonas palustris]|nr:hypothetical protein [Rhodopseudomonas palustris]